MEQRTGSDIEGSEEVSAGYDYALTVVTPTYNECDNVRVLIERLERCLVGVNWNIIVVDDDSPDGTADVVRSLLMSKPNIECIQRKSRRGLAGAVADGIMEARAPLVAVIDADLQHDEKALPTMLALMTAKRLDLLVCSRFKHTMTTEGLSRLRTWASHIANAVAKLLSGKTLTDPMSGYFMVRRARFVEIADQIYPEGFKILFNILMVSKPSLRLEEIGIEFSPRIHGQSKLSVKVMFDFFRLLVWHKTGHSVPPRFLPFGIVGFAGLGVHGWLLYLTRELEFFFSQLIAIFVTMAFNYCLNNFFTYGDKQKKGWDFVIGFVNFSMACISGAIISYSSSLALVLFLPEAVAGISGAILGGVWNFIATRKLVWEEDQTGMTQR